MLLEMSNVSKTFPGVKALHQVNFDLKKNEVHVIMGENGAGKSTLMKILGGIINADQGTISIEGKNISFLNPLSAKTHGISFIHQELCLADNLTVAENIMMGRIPTTLGIVDSKKLLQKTKEYLDFLDLAIHPNELIQNLSVSLQQMVEITKAVSLNGKILIMDEPTASLTELEITKLFKLIKSLKNQGVGIIYISHRMDEIFRIGDRVTILRDGKSIVTKNITDISESELIKTMVGREISNQYPAKLFNPGSMLLEIDNISNNHVKNVSFHLMTKEIIGIAGLVGSGRTETARAIFGADPILQGSISIEGQKVNLSSPTKAIDAGIAFITEDRKQQGLVLDLSVADNMLLSDLESFSTLGIVNKNDATSFIDKSISRLKIKCSNANQQILHLSGGNQQKVVLAKWLSRRLKIIIFDEPTRGIDVGAKYEIYELMHELIAQGIGIIMISSDMSEVIGMSNRIYVMHEKTIATELCGESLTAENIGKYAFGAV
ncbi:sugar ABC transporter ATP-binding protein [Bacteriovoracaceae bacterium]|nr:sugar ABC transporter ATP-binding protein [Bacteriovoracaceae bacterium]